MNSKDDERQKIKDDIKKFLESGGVIQKVDSENNANSAHILEPLAIRRKKGHNKRKEIDPESN